MGYYTTVLPFAAGLEAGARARLLKAYSEECYLTADLAAAITAQQEAMAAWRELGDVAGEGDSLQTLAHTRCGWSAGRRPTGPDGDQLKDRSSQRGTSSLLRSFITETTIATVSTTAMTASEMAVGMWYHSDDDHLHADEGQDHGQARAAGTSNRSCRSASRKYSARRPRMAKAFDANTMNCSRLTARTAGTESTAKITSVASISTSTANSGVASRLPSMLAVNSFCPSYSVGGRHDPAHEPQHRVVLGVDLLVVARTRAWTPVKSRNAPKT